MKYVRIILSPFVFVFIFISLLIIPIGVMCLFLGTIELLRAFLKQEKIDKEDFIFPLMWLILPYMETKKFVINEIN